MKEGNNIGYGLLLLGLALAAGITASTFLATRTIERVKLNNKTITVKGVAEREIVSDLTVWRCNFGARAPDMVTAYNTLQAHLEKVLQHLINKGIPRDGIVVSPAATTVIYKMTDKGVRANEIEAYLLEYSLEIRSANVALIDGLSKDATSLIKEGVALTSLPPEFYYTRINDLKLELLGEATRNARQRAEQLVNNSGSRVGSLHSANQGIFQITPVNSTEVSDYGAYDTSTIQKTVKAVITMEFGIRQ